MKQIRKQQIRFKKIGVKYLQNIKLHYYNIVSFSMSCNSKYIDVVKTELLNIVQYRAQPQDLIESWVANAAGKRN